MKQNLPKNQTLDATAATDCRTHKWLLGRSILLAALLSFFCCFLPHSVQAKDSSKQENHPDFRERLRRIERQEQREYRQRAFPLAQIPHGARQRALDQIKQAEKLSPASPTFGGGFAWFNLGPSPINDTTSPVSCGRV